jgi:hypothetical protein
MQYVDVGCLLCRQYLDNVLVKPPTMDLSGLRPLW